MTACITFVAWMGRRPRCRPNNFTVGLSSHFIKSQYNNNHLITSCDSGTTENAGLENAGPS